MQERGQEFRSAEEVQAAALAEFGVNLNDRGAVMAKARELNDAARGGAGKHDYSKIERLNNLLDTYDRMTGNSQEVKKAA